MFGSSIPIRGAKEVIQEPLTKPRPVLDPDLEVSEKTYAKTDSHVYVHCYFQNEWKDALVRIWKTSFLIDQATGLKSALLHAENISIAPVWTLIADNRTHDFLLIFEGLPNSCTQFDFIEEISQPGGFCVRNIPRNQQDVYHVDV